MISAIIFGVSGQDGYYLSHLLNSINVRVIGISRSAGDRVGDVSNIKFVKEVISLYRPSYIFHFAANSITSHSALFENHNAISTGTINILEVARMFVPECKVFISGSALQFQNYGLPINESTPFESKYAYSVSRIHSVITARYYRDVYGMKVYVGYFFNHDSPRRNVNHINQKIVHSVKRIANREVDFFEIGDLVVRKEFSFAGDVVRAVWILVNQDEIYEAVIGSGIHYSILDWVEICFKEYDLNWKNYVKVNNNFESDYKILVSDPCVIKSLGWKQEIDIMSLARMMIGNLS